MNGASRGPADLPLTRLRLVLLGVGVAMFLAQIAGAAAVAPAVTGPGDASVAVLAGLWVACIAWSVAAALCVIRQADLPDIATASMIVTIPACGAFSLAAAYAVRDTQQGTNLSDALMLGVTGGGLTAMIVWGISMAVARAMKLPRSPN